MAHGPSQGTPIRVLHVDEDDSFRRRFQAGLGATEAVDIDVVSHTDPQAALDLLSTGAIDCVVSATDLSGTSGLAFLDAVRESFGNLPFLLVTATRSADLAEEAVARGVTDVFEKRDTPGQFTLLANRILKAVEHSDVEQALRESEQRYRTLVERSHDAIYICRGTSFEFVNEGVCELTAYDESELYEMDSFDLIHPDDRGAVRELVSKGQDQADAPSTYRARILRKDGEVRHVDVSVQQVEYAGEPAVLGSARDITERHRVNQRYQAMLEHSSDVITVLDEDGTIQYQTPAIERVLGYDPEALVGEDPLSYVHPADSERVREHFARLREAEESTTERVEFRFQSADGSWRWLEAVGIYRPDPVIDGYVINSRDVTDRKERRDTLEALQGTARELMHAETKTEVAEVVYETADEVLDLPLVGVWLYDEEENVLRPAAYPDDPDAVPDDPPTFTPGNSLAWEAFEAGEVRIYDDVQSEEATHNPETTIRSELIVPFADYGVLNSGSPAQQNFDETDRSLAEILGATTMAAFERVEHSQERLARQRELERQNERLETFASVVSHDLRNPLTVARGYLDLIEGNEDAVDAIRQAVERMDQIIADVLSMTRQGQPVEQTRPVALPVAAEKAWETTETAGVTLDTEQHHIEADPQRLQQILENLFRNAVEHGSPSTPSNSQKPPAERGEPGRQATELTVRVGPLDDGFYVEDDGRGIPEADRPDVFDRGFSTHERGSGLGLAIVEQIASAHGWSVRVTDSASGGARFEFTDVDTPTRVDHLESVPEGGPHC